MKSTSSSRSVLAMEPITAAEAAIFTGLLNMIENPNTPTKLAARRSTRSSAGDRPSSVKAPGLMSSAMDMPHAVIVAIMTMITA